MQGVILTKAAFTGNYLHHRYVGMHLIAFSLIFTATCPYRICLKEKKDVRRHHIQTVKAESSFILTIKETTDIKTKQLEILVEKSVSLFPSDMI